VVVISPRAAAKSLAGQFHLAHDLHEAGGDGICRTAGAVIENGSW
jgi:hypothetical protein